ncbi:unnamed protein product [Ectocarpus fasciculatus]
MSGATMARANFKKYTDITNPLAAGQTDTPDGSNSTDAWRGSENPKSGQQKEEGEGDDEEEDPFGLGSIMSKAEKDEEEEEEEEEDPFGLGAIMDEPNKDPDTPTSKRSGSADDSRQKKAQKTTADGTTGGYFKGTTSLTPAQSSVAEASRQPFRAAGSFDGARSGYVFQKGPLGLGYYADKVQIRAAAAADAVVAASRAKSRGPEARGSGVRLATESGEKKAQTVDVAASLQKLKVFILKPKKAAKAASLLADLMKAHMRPENARVFFRALKPLAEEPSGEAALAAGEGGARAFRMLAERASEWVGAPSEGVRAVTWELLFGLRHDTKTDDSFTFARAIKRLREAIEALGDVAGGGKATDGTAREGDDGEGTGSAGGNGISLSLERKTALILVMKEAFKSYHLAWARSSIEPAFKAAADRRRLFPEGELRDTLDSFTDAITKRQRNPGGLMAPPSRSVRAHNSTAHPMLNKRSDVIR